ncbi:MAG: hypothetical protein NZ651_01120 [Candidatus Bipolaricaulota bacterium]|nr:hypothetical protein [Candidatus Bipolaricaulota bacterium]MDW8126369.1 hypothetical protein [Candidatus Bipolaricaulota bacterium]
MKVMVAVPGAKLKVAETFGHKPWRFQRRSVRRVRSWLVAYAEKLGPSKGGLGQERRASQPTKEA